MRHQRVAEQMREELARLMREEMKDPRIGFASITRIDMSTDLRVAKVHISVLGDQEAKKNTMKGLESASGFLRGEVTRQLRLRVAPELRFVLDESIEHGSRISTLLHQLKNEPGGTHE